LKFEELKGLPFFCFLYRWSSSGWRKY